MKPYLMFALALALAGGACAQATTPLEPAVLVTLKFTGDRVEVGSKENREAFVVSEFGMPQLEPLFFEAYGADGEVVFAGALPEPTIASMPAFDSGKPTGDTIELDEGAVTLVIPASAKPQKLKVFRRISDDPEKGRELLLESAL